MSRVLIALACLVTLAAPAYAASPPTAATNHQAAMAEAARLVALAPASLPPGSTPSAAVPAAAGPAFGTPSVTSLAATTVAYSVPAVPGAVLTWLKTHPPHGLRYLGTGMNRSGSVAIDGYAWTAAPSVSWTQAWLQIGATADGAGGSDVRVDAQVVWLDPVPYRDSQTGRRVHVAATGPCPGSVTGLAGVRNAGNDLHSALLPTAAPTGGLVCTYQGGHRLTQRRLTASRARQVAAAARAVPLAHADGGAYSCPAIAGAEQVRIVALRYPRRPDVDLWVSGTSANGCGAGLANGVIQGPSGSVPALVR